jgi:hypothetical protein
MSANSRKQSAILANPARHDLLVEKMPILVPAVYGDVKAFVFLRFMVL